MFSTQGAFYSNLILGVNVITGIYLSLAYDFAYALWFIFKIGALVVLVTLATVALRRSNKLMAVLALVIYVYIILLSILKSVTLDLV